MAIKKVIIGENMKRIKQAAKQIGAIWYQAWTIEPWDPSLALRRNEAWIRRKMKESCQIIDIGIDPTRATRSPFYAMEKRILKEESYTIVQYGTILSKLGGSI